jgi:hypothetical protein
MMNIFKKLIKNVKRDWDIGEICYYAKIYREIEIKEPIKIKDNIYAVKYCNDLLFFVKESNWKKYIGVKRVFLESSSYDVYYKSNDLKHIINCKNIPSEMIEIMYDELIIHKDELKNILEDKKKEEFYK